MHRNKDFCGVAMVALFVVMSSESARAQTAGSTADGSAATVVPSIVVTAEKRQQRIIDVPYAITAISSGEIQQRGVTDIQDLQYSIPGLAIQSTPSAGDQRYQLRGIDAGNGTGAPVVGIYVDDVGISVNQQQRDTTFPLIDLDRIEVLRGPQGTLYGQASEAGTIRFITHDPNLDHIDGFFEGGGDAPVTGDAGYKVNGAVSIPIIKDQFGVRLTAGYEQDGGYVNYPNAGVKNANAVDTSFVRAKFLWEPNSKLTTSLLLQYDNIEEKAAPLASNFTYDINHSTTTNPSSDKSNLANLIINYNLGSASIVSSTGFAERGLIGSGVPIGFPLDDYASNENLRQWTEELRLVSNNDGPWRYVTGLYFRDYSSSEVAGIPQIGYSSNTTDPANSISYAIFGDVTRVITPNLEASVGLRYYIDQQNFYVYRPNGVVIPADDQKATFHDLSPRFNIKYDISPNDSVYFQAAKGFRSGGFNSSSLDPSYGPESLWSYEVGTKSTLFDGKLYIDADVYYLDYTNRQSESFTGGLPLAVTTNGGAAAGPGEELTAIYKLPYQINLTGTVAHNDVKYDQNTFDVRKGERFSYVPATTGSVSLDERFRISESFNGFWRVDYQHADSYQSILRIQTGLTTSLTAIYVTPPQDLMNINLGVDHGPYTITATWFNVTGSKAINFQYGYPGLTGVATHVRPENLGLALRYRF